MRRAGLAVLPLGFALAAVAATCHRGAARSLVLLEITAAADVPEVERVVVEAGPVTEIFDGALRRDGVDEPLRVGLYLPSSTTGIVDVRARAVNAAGVSCGSGALRVMIGSGKTATGKIVIAANAGFDCTASGDGGTDAQDDTGDGGGCPLSFSDGFEGATLIPPWDDIVGMPMISSVAPIEGVHSLLSPLPGPALVVKYVGMQMRARVDFRVDLGGVVPMTGGSAVAPVAVVLGNNPMMGTLDAVHVAFGRGAMPFMIVRAMAPAAPSPVTYALPGLAARIRLEWISGRADTPGVLRVFINDAAASPPTIPLGGTAMLVRNIRFGASGMNTWTGHIKFDSVTLDGCPP